VSAPDDPRSELAELTRQARAWVQWVADSGVDELPRSTKPRTTEQPAVADPAPLATRPEEVSPAAAAPAEAAPAEAAPAKAAPLAMAPPQKKPAQAAKPSPAETSAEVPSIEVPKTAAARSARLAELADEVSRCTKCELHETRNHTVFSRGSAAAKLVFVGEGPGADEDAHGLPFVGKAGQLLDRMILAMGCQRDEVYICNVVKCRPPGNRNPQPAEAANCRGFLNRQLAVIKPEFICCLGAVAAQSLLEVKTPIGKLRGDFHDYQGIRVLCTYHPAYLLRDPSKKRDTWDDLQILLAAMGIELPKK
jgi:uracil-DNA glycosylase family 4